MQPFDRYGPVRDRAGETYSVFPRHGPPPEPLVGQVWATPRGDGRVDTVERGSGKTVVYATLPLADGLSCFHEVSVWPPPDAVLVWGPGSPWAPEGWDSFPGGA